MQCWQRIESVCAGDGAEGFPTFGVQVTTPDGTVWQWADVDPDPAVTDRLVARLQAVQPEPCHWQEMVLDFICEVATPAL